MIFGPSDAEFQEVFEGIKKWIYQKWPKQRDSNGRPDQATATHSVSQAVEYEIYWRGINKSNPPTDVPLFTSHS